MLSRQVTVLAAFAVISLFATAQLSQADEDSESVLQEIIVTAQKRAENLQAVPIAITAVTSQDLENHQGYDFQQIASLIPGLQFSLEGEDVNIMMRGYPGNPPADGCEQPRRALSGWGAAAGDLEYQAIFTDTARVEVARGPQGTLSGRNAYAGSVNIVTNQPQFGVTQFGFSSSATNYSGTREELFLNVPAGDMFAVRLSAFRERREGVIVNSQDPSNSLQDLNNDYVRLQVGFRPSDNVLQRDEIRELGGKRERLGRLRLDGAGYSDQSAHRAYHRRCYQCLLHHQPLGCFLLRPFRQSEHRLGDRCPRLQSSARGRYSRGRSLQYPCRLGSVQHQSERPPPSRHQHAGSQRPVQLGHHPRSVSYEEFSPISIIRSIGRMMAIMAHPAE